jgi:hypothetical protein
MKSQIREAQLPVSNDVKSHWQKPSLMVRQPRLGSQRNVFADCLTHDNQYIVPGRSGTGWQIMQLRFLFRKVSDIAVKSFSCFPAICGLILWLTGCSNQPEPAVPKSDSGGAAAIVESPKAAAFESPFRFEECAGQLGINHVYRDGAEREFYTIVESLGGGLGILDFNGDGHIDVFAPGGGDFDSSKTPFGLESRLFRSLPAESGTLNAIQMFAECSTAAGVSHADHYSHGAIVSDFNNDGFDDVLVTGYGGLQLFHNNGDGTFFEATTSAGLTDHLWSSSAAWADFNGDGANDIYVAHYVNWRTDNDPLCFTHGDSVREVCPPRSFTGLPDTLYLSDGAGGFIEESGRLGEYPPGKGLGVVAADIDLDGDVDVYVTNDTTMNFLLMNESHQSFRECGASSATGFSDTGREDGSMGVDIGDYNGDCLPDVWVTNYENETFALYRSFDGQIFQHVSRSTGISAACGLSVGWGTRFGDLDLDGDEDLFVANGHVIRHPINSPLNQRPLLLMNDNQKRFQDVTNGSGAYFKGQYLGRGVAEGDLGNDGDLDIFVSNINQPLAVLRNDSVRFGNWLVMQLIGVKSSRWAEGAWIEFEFDDGKKILRLVKGGTSYASTSDRRVHVGLGQYDQIAQITIHWPSGTVQYLRNVSVNQQLQIVESLTRNEVPVAAGH